MQMRITAAILVVMLLNTLAMARTSPEKEAQFLQKVKTEIAKLGTGPKARIELKLRDKTKLKGYVSEVNDDSFAVVDDKNGSATTVTYPQVKQVKGNNLHTGVKIAIGVGILIGVLLLIGPHIAM